MRLGFYDIKKLFIQIVVRPPNASAERGSGSKRSSPRRVNPFLQSLLCQFIREMKKTPTRAMVSTSAFLHSRI